MSTSPDNEPDHLQNWPQEHAGESGAPDDRPPLQGWESEAPATQGSQKRDSASWGAGDTPAPQPWEPTHPAASLSAISEPVAGSSIESWQPASQPTPEVPPFLRMVAQPDAPERIPHIGHFFFLTLVILPMGLLATGLLLALALHEHLYGISTTQQAVGNIHYLLGSEGVLYIVSFVIAYFVFPIFWHKSFFAGLQWNGATALRVRRRLFSAAVVCCFIAVINGVLIPEPTNTPIEKVFRAPGAAWFLFAFGVTFAPFFEETFFRGFLLPSLCTAYDWIVETITHKAAPPLGPNGHPQWSLAAMIVGSIATSIPFAWMHAEQTGYAIGPFLLLVGVSLVLCACGSARALSPPA